MLWTVDELCENLKLKKSSVYQMTSGKKIPVVKVGGLLRFDPDEIEQWLNEKRRPPIDAA